MERQSGTAAEYLSASRGRPFVRTLPEPQYDRLFEIYRHVYRYGVRAEGASFGDLYRRHSWESSYVVESQTAELLRLRSQTAGNISQYVAAEIPDYVKDGITVKNVRAEAEKPFL